MLYLLLIRFPLALLLELQVGTIEGLLLLIRCYDLLQVLEVGVQLLIELSRHLAGHLLVGDLCYQLEPLGN